MITLKVFRGHLGICCLQELAPIGELPHAQIFLNIGNNVVVEVDFKPVDDGRCIAEALRFNASKVSSLLID